MKTGQANTAIGQLYFYCSTAVESIFDGCQTKQKKLVEEVVI